MAAKRAPRQDQRSDTILLRAIGSLALAATDLERVLRASDSPEERWQNTAERLLADSAKVMLAAHDSTHHGDGIVVSRKGAVVPISIAYLDRLTEQIHRIAQIGAATAVEPEAPAPPSRRFEEGVGGVTI